MRAREALIMALSMALGVTNHRVDTGQKVKAEAERRDEGARKTPGRRPVTAAPIPVYARLELTCATHVS